MSERKGGSILAKAAELRDAVKAAEPWDTPVPLDDPTEAPEPFPLEVLPAGLANLCANIGSTINCPPDYAACFALATMAGTCGAAIAVNVKGGWEEHASLFVCAVAPPNAGKTPSFKIVTKPVIEEQSRRYQSEVKEPAYVSDITVEKLAEILKETPRGTLLLRDELAGWVKGMDQYKSGKGSDRQFWLSVWSSDSVSVHRKNPDSPHVFIAHPCVSVVGGIQPEVLKALAGNDDGFFDRVLFCYPRTIPARGENWRTPDTLLTMQWSGALEKVRSIGMLQDQAHGLRPRFVALSPDARKEWERFTNQQASEINNPDFPSHLRGVAGKITGYGARLALVRLLLRIAYDPHGDLEDISGDDMAAGAKLARYFLAHAKLVYGAAGRDRNAEEAKTLLRWITAQNKPTISRRDAHRSLRKTFIKPESLTDPFRRLVQHGFLRYAASTGAGTGRPASPTYDVHPLLLSGVGDKSDKSDKTPEVPEK